MTAAARDRQHLYGLTFETNFPLFQSRPADGVPADVTVTLAGTRARQDDTPDGELMLDFAQGDDHWYSLVRRGDGSLVFRVYTLCDFEISTDLRDVTMHLVAGVDDGMASIMVVGTLAALLLYLRGSLVLHASAVELDGQAVAFTGHSGMGKSTLAGLVAAAGARVVSDDVVPVRLDGGAWIPPGATELRLRPGTELFEDRLRGVASGARRSADSREVVRFDGAGGDDVPLAGIFIPWPNRSDRLEMERLPPQHALVALMSFPRLMGWRDPGVLRMMFEQAGELVRSVPVFRAHVPWGPPFRDDIADAVRDAAAQAAGASL
ncbi:hypothetical protein GCM10023221_12750 [Luteimicrobium xylanilyticum]|uniref:HPr kinase/phosphorylase n=1 Tax=Luteimicrobium xylanilyticum TaxID=1133546 RepID=A0A5P9QDS6_9MICO|nr:hypothetical protein [Luteimicrobium xylanilyticum]QFU99252.1 hypothetical protein KDY119_02779 [Luteimicrobium xylanilyticum]